MILGDSLSAGYGLPRDKALTSQLEAALKERGVAASVPNTAVSGDTTTGGLQRLDWLLADKPDLVVVALGGNDGLRGIDPAITRDNIDRILAKLKEKGVPALLAGMLAPPNLGRDYGQAFNAVFPDMARKYQVPLYPFLLEGVIPNKALLLDDGLHPNAEGVAVMVRGLLPAVTRALSGAQAGGPPARTKG